MTRCHHVFETAIGPCAIAWTERGIARLLLPGEDPAGTLEAEGWHARQPPPTIARVVAAVQAHLAGGAGDLADIPLDLEGVGPFAREVYAHAQRLPRGEVCTYGEMAAALGKPGAARAVGQALGRNPVPLIIPCHRIVASGGKPGGFSAPGGRATKARLLEIEGRPLPGPPTLFATAVVERATAHLGRDRRLKRVIDAVGPFRLKRRGETVFESLCESIIYQQLAGSAAAAITRRFRALFEAAPQPASVVAVDDETYRSAGLSAAKIGSLRGLAQAALDGRVRLDHVPHMADEEISQHLTAVKGIGPWTVQMLLIFHLGRPDVFPVGDLGIRKAMQRLRKLEEMPRPQDMHALGERWEPWRTVASWYLWRSLETAGWSGD